MQIFHLLDSLPRIILFYVFFSSVPLLPLICFARLLQFSLPQLLMFCSTISESFCSSQLGGSYTERFSIFELLLLSPVYPEQILGCLSGAPRNLKFRAVDREGGSGHTAQSPPSLYRPTQPYAHTSCHPLAFPSALVLPLFYSAPPTKGETEAWGNGIYSFLLSSCLVLQLKCKVGRSFGEGRPHPRKSGFQGPQGKVSQRHQ